MNFFIIQPIPTVLKDFSKDNLSKMPLFLAVIFKVLQAHWKIELVA